MSRELKFKLWDGKKMITLWDPRSRSDVYLYYGKNGIQALKEWSGETEHFEDDVTGIFLQYTGRVDRNKREIYEGDIIKYDSSEIYQKTKWKSKVYWSNGSFKVDSLWPYNTNNLEESTHHIGKTINSVSTNYAEVIGNIYENPELV